MRTTTLIGTVLVILGPACFGGQVGDPANDDLDPTDPEFACTIPESEIVSGGPGIDGIPALLNPTFVGAGDAGARYLRDDDRVVGLLIGDSALAVPLNILWWHEIVNLDRGARRLAITHCPLTGSSLVFDRTAIDGLTLGVSGLLYNNNLLMYDRDEPFSLWPQMLRGARCGRKTGTDLPMVASVEMEWAEWRALHPATRVVAEDTGHRRDYTDYPYGSYDREDNRSLLFPVSIDERRPPKERVLGIPGTSGAVALPFGALDALGATVAVQVSLDGRGVVVFWDRGARAAAAFESRLGVESLTFRVVGNAIVDDGTGSAWRTDGLATSGPLAGQRLTPVPEAFVAYWFAWAVFYPDASLWQGTGK